MRVGIGEAIAHWLRPDRHNPASTKLVRRLKYFRNVRREIYNAIGAGAYLAGESRSPTRNLVKSAGKFSSRQPVQSANSTLGFICRAMPGSTPWTMTNM
jgi:hypothetical protein